MIYTIADLHLSLATDKPMDVFGDKWRGYVGRLEENWQNVVSKDDTVVIPGDISWAMKLEDALADFTFIDRLNGKKIIFKGNHDYFWETNAKLSAFFEKNNIKTISMLKNTALEVENIAVCGTKGFCYDTDISKDQNAKLLNRETLRLKASLEDANRFGDKEKVVFLHYPPVYRNNCIRELIDCMKEHGVKRCYYGHLHSSGIENGFQGEFEGITFKLISADGIDFCPIKI